MSNLTISIPDPSNYLHDNSRSIAIAVVLIVAAVLASILVEFYRRHYNVKKQQALAKHWTALWLTASSGVFTALGYLAVLLQSNTGLVSTLPFVGKHVAGTVGIAYFLYNIRLNKTYKTVAAWLSKFSGTKVPASIPAVTEPVPPSDTTAPGSFL